jgi:hypothetical protein
MLVVRDSLTVDFLRFFLRLNIDAATSQTRLANGRSRAMACPHKSSEMNKQQAFTTYSTMVPQPDTPPSTASLGSVLLEPYKQLVGMGVKQLLRLAQPDDSVGGPGGTTTSTCPTMVPDAIAPFMASAKYNNTKTIKMNAVETKKGEF